MPSTFIPGRCPALTALLFAGPFGCAASTVRGGYCAPPAVAFDAYAPEPPPADTAPHEAQVAALVGLGGVTAQEVSQSTATRLRVVERLELASVAIGATSAELDCERERAEEAADFLARGQADSVQALTIGSIAAAALTGIVGVFLSTTGASPVAQDSTAIAGGAATAGLGLASLYVRQKTTFDHPRNLLADVWLGPRTSATYPPVIWTYFTRPVFSNTRTSPIREKIVERWKHFREVDDRATAAILFGNGGSYDVESLRLRSAMLGEVKAEVELTRQELAALAASLLR